MRSRLTPNAGGDADGGITSACAEQTRSVFQRNHPGTDHLRVCGADNYLVAYNDYPEGSPPRVRSRRIDALTDVAACGITSACAEQTHLPVGR